MTFDIALTIFLVLLNGFFVAAEFATPIQAFELQAEFAATPEHFLHVGRVGSTPYLHHFRLREWQFCRIVYHRLLLMDSLNLLQRPL